MKTIVTLLFFMLANVALATWTSNTNHVVVKTFKVGATSGYDVKPVEAGTYEVMAIPAGSIVKNVMVLMSAAVTGSSAETIGDGDDVDGYLEDGFAAGTGLLPSYKTGATPSYAGDYLNPLADYSADNQANGFKYYSSADTIDLVFTGTPSAGTGKIFIEFMRL